MKNILLIMSAQERLASKQRKYIGIGQNELKNIGISDIGKNPISCIPTKLVYLKFSKREQLILYLMHFNCVEVMLMSNLSVFDCANVELLQVYFRYTLNTTYLAFKDQYYSKII